MGSCWDPTAAECPWLHEEKTLELLSRTTGSTFWPNEAQGRMLAVQRHTNRTDRIGGDILYTVTIRFHRCSFSKAARQRQYTLGCTATTDNSVLWRHQKRTVWSVQQKKKWICYFCICTKTARLVLLCTELLAEIYPTKPLGFIYPTPLFRIWIKRKFQKITRLRLHVTATRSNLKTT